MEIILGSGEYKGCEVDVFYKGIKQYFKDDEKNCDVPLENYEHKIIEK